MNLNSKVLEQAVSVLMRGRANNDTQKLAALLLCARDNYQSKLTRLDSTTEIYRTQGAVIALDELIEIFSDPKEIAARIEADN